MSTDRAWHIKLKLSKGRSTSPSSGFFGNWDCLPDDVKIILNGFAARETDKQNDLIRRLRILADYGMSKQTVYR